MCGPRGGECVTLGIVEACGSAEDPGEEMDRRFQLATGAPAGWFARLLAAPRPPSALEEHIRERQRKKLWAIAFQVRMLLNI